MQIPFTKMSGAGNDFVVVDNRRGIVRDAATFARTVCDRRWAVGADGLLLVEPSRKVSYRMMYFNADGSYGGMCGNGGRCIALFAAARGIAPSSHSFEALDHVYAVAAGDPARVRLSLKNPSRFRRDISLTVAGKNVRADFVDTGSPHAVVFASAFVRHADALDRLDVERLGRAVRRHRAFAPEGVNVNFVQLEDKGIVRMRTYERGVEGETLACGTGAVASALVAYLRGKASSPVTIQARSGKFLTVEFKETSPGEFSDVALIGPAQTTFEGVWEA